MAKPISANDFAAFVATPMILLANLRDQPLAFLQDLVWQSKLGDLARLVHRARTQSCDASNRAMITRCLLNASTHFLIKSDVVLFDAMHAKEFPHEEFFVSYHMVASVLQHASYLVGKLSTMIQTGQLSGEKDYRLVVVYANDTTPSTTGFVLGILMQGREQVLH